MLKYNVLLRNRHSLPVRSVFTTITELAVFERLAVRLLDVDSWTDLLTGVD